MARFEKKVYTEINRYVRGEMTPEQRMDYEIKLSLDPELQKEVRFQDFLVKSLAYGHRRQLHKYLYENASTKLWGNAWGRTGTIISFFIVLIAAIAFFVINSKRTSPVDFPDKDDTRLERKATPPAAKPATPLDTPATGADTLDAVPGDTLNGEGLPAGNEETENFKAIPPKQVVEKKDGPEEFAENTDPADTIRGDVLIREITLTAAPLESSLADSLNLAATNGNARAGEAYSLQIWESPVNFTGYKAEKKKITVYGIDRNQRVELRTVGNNLFLLAGGNIYQIEQTQSFRPLKPVTPPQAPKSKKRK